jgi:hypothetical protein
MDCWAQEAPDHATARLLLVRHMEEAHKIGPEGPLSWVLARLDAKLAHCPYRPAA